MSGDKNVFTGTGDIINYIVLNSVPPDRNRFFLPVLAGIPALLWCINIWQHSERGFQINPALLLLSVVLFSASFLWMAVGTEIKKLQRLYKLLQSLSWSYTGVLALVTVLALSEVGLLPQRESSFWAVFKEDTWYPRIYRLSRAVNFVSPIPASISPDGEHGEMAHIPYGWFKMRDTSQRVWLNDYYISGNVVTKREYLEFLNAPRDSWQDFIPAGWWDNSGWNINMGERRAEWKGDDAAELEHPVRVTWNQANGYCLWRAKETGVKHRLPTEAEWEKACSSERFNPPIKGRLEWCLDPYSADGSRHGSRINPVAQSENSWKVVRGLKSDEPLQMHCVERYSWDLTNSRQFRVTRLLVKF